MMMKFSKKSLLGYGLIVISMVSRMASSVAVQLLERRVPDFELGVFRYIGGVLLAAALLIPTKTKLEISIESYQPIIIMGFCTMMFNLVIFFAVSVVPLSHASSFALVSAAVSVLIISKVLLDKRPNIFTILCILGCIIGMLVLVQPWLGFSEGFTPGFVSKAEQPAPQPVNSSDVGREEVPDSHSSWLLLLGYLALIVAGATNGMFIFIAGAYVKHIPPSVIVFVTSAIAAVLSIVACFYMEEPVVITDPYFILLVSIHALGTGLAVMTEVCGCQMVGSLQVAIMLNFTTVLNLISQYTILRGHLYGRMNFLEVFGCFVIGISITVSALLRDNEHHEDFN